MTMAEYCRNILGVSEKTIYYRLRNGFMYLDDIDKIIKLTGKSFHELFEPFMKVRVPVPADKVINNKAASKNTAQKKEDAKELFIEI